MSPAANAIMVLVNQRTAPVVADEGTAARNVVTYRNHCHIYVGVQRINPYPTAFPYGNGMVIHFYQQQESSTTKTVHKVINRGLKTYV